MLFECVCKGGELFDERLYDGEEVADCFVVVVLVVIEELACFEDAVGGGVQDFVCAAAGGVKLLGGGEAVFGLERDERFRGADGVCVHDFRKRCG